MSTDDFIGAYIESIGDRDIIPSVDAAKLVALWRVEDPKGLRAWLDSHAEAFVHDEISRRFRAQRRHARSSAARFGDAAKNFEETGDPQSFGVYFATREMVNEQGVQRCVGEMTGNDHLYVAECKTLQGNALLAVAAFHRAIAKKVGSRRTCDVFTEADYAKMMNSLVG
jgi:hypothetical protein